MARAEGWPGLAEREWVSKWKHVVLAGIAAPCVCSRIEFLKD